MHWKQHIKVWAGQFWQSQVDAINDSLAEIDIEPPVILNRRDLWMTWAKIAAGVVLAAALFYLALTHGGNAP